MAYDPRLPAGLGIPSMGGFSAPAGPRHGAACEPSTRTQSPIVTGTGVVGIKFNGGVMLASDTLGEYKRNCQTILSWDPTEFFFSKRSRDYFLILQRRDLSTWDNSSLIWSRHLSHLLWLSRESKLVDTNWSLRHLRMLLIYFS
jgi:hypothetical protein